MTLPDTPDGGTPPRRWEHPVILTRDMLQGVGDANVATVIDVAMRFYPGAAGWTADEIADLCGLPATTVHDAVVLGVERRFLRLQQDSTYAVWWRS